MSPAPAYRVVPCRTGACAVRTSAELERMARLGRASGAPGGVMLPDTLGDDLVQGADIHPYPDSVTLDRSDLDNLGGLDSRSFACTHYGPAGQDKAVNEDFALAGRLERADGRVARFAIVADGVSNGFAFPQRGAQLSAFAAYFAMKALWHELENPEAGSIDDATVGRLRDDVVRRIRTALREDREFLRAVDVSPAHIDADVWRDRLVDRPERWYGNTLIVALVSDAGGCLLFSGDGAIVLIKGDAARATEVQRSTDDPVVSDCVTMDVTAASFRGAAVALEPGLPYVEIILATDGLDRTFARAGRSLVELFGSDVEPAAVVRDVARLDRLHPDALDVDNYSVARVLHVLGDPPADRMTASLAVAGRARPDPDPKSTRRAGARGDGTGGARARPRIHWSAPIRPDRDPRESPSDTLSATAPDGEHDTAPGRSTTPDPTGTGAPESAPARPAPRTPLGPWFLAAACLLTAFAAGAGAMMLVYSDGRDEAVDAVYAIEAAPDHASPIASPIASEVPATPPSPAAREVDAEPVRENPHP